MERDRQLVGEKMLGVGTFVWERDNVKILDGSKALMELIESEDDILTVDKVKGLILDTDRREFEDSLDYNIEAKKVRFDQLLRIKTESESIKRINLRASCEYDEEGLLNMVGVVMDLSFDNQRDYSTRLNDEKFFRLFGDAPIGISMLRTDGTCFLCNDSFVNSVFFKEYELKDIPFQVLIDDEDQHKFVNMYSNMTANKIPSFRNDFRIVNKNGEKVWHDITVTAVKDIYDNVKYIIVMMQPSQRNGDATARKGIINTIREELNDLSLRDSMSGLYNRQYALRKLREFILVFYEKNLSFSVLLIDVDEIKKINETYGYECGDKIIHDLSEIFKSLTRDTDIGARWGGEEFVIMFPEMDIDTALKLGERLRNEVKNTILMWEGKEIQMTVTVSVTAYTSDDTLKTFINKVDKALYDDKGDQRDLVRVI